MVSGEPILESACWQNSYTDGYNSRRNFVSEKFSSHFGKAISVLLPHLPEAVPLLSYMGPYNTSKLWQDSCCSKEGGPCHYKFRHKLPYLQAISDTRILTIDKIFTLKLGTYIYNLMKSGSLDVVPNTQTYYATWNYPSYANGQIMAPSRCLFLPFQFCAEFGT